MRNKAISVGIIALMLFGAFTVVISTGTENVKAADDSGLVAYWDFDEGTGTVLHDKSGNGNDGTIYGASWVDGVKGKALKFDRRNCDYVQIPASDSLKSIGNEFTIETFVKLYSYPDTGDHMETLWMFQRPYSTGNENLAGFGVEQETQPEHSLVFYDYYSENHLNTFYVPPLDEWIFTTVVGYPNGTLSVFIDGHKIAKHSWTRPLNMTDMENLWFGIDIDYDSEKTDALDGCLDEVHIYNRALTAEEIQSQYNEIAHPPQNSGGGSGSTPGFEANLTLLSTIGVAVIGYYIRRREK